MGELSGVWIIVFIILLVAAFSGKPKNRGGVIVKNYPKDTKKGNPPPAGRPKVMPAPQKRK